MGLYRTDCLSNDVSIDEISMVIDLTHWSIIII